MAINNNSDVGPLTRRDFIKAGGLSIATLLALHAFPSCRPGTPDKIPPIQPDAPKTEVTPDVIFSYGRFLQYWTEEDRLAGIQTLKGLASWRIEQVAKPKQAQPGNQVVLRSDHYILNQINFQPQSVDMEGAQYAYVLPFTINASMKPEIIFVPPLSNTWSQFTTGFDIDARVVVSDIQKGIETVTIKIIPQGSFGHVSVSLTTNKDVTILTNSASPPIDQWNIAFPETNKSYIFSVQLQLKNVVGEAVPYKPKVNIDAGREPVTQKKQSGQSIGTDVPGLGSLIFQSTKAGVLEIGRSDQIKIYLWQSSASFKVPELLPPVIGWGLCRSFDDKQNPVGNSLLFSSEDAQAIFWADIDTQAFEKAVSVEFDWMDPSGQSHKTKQQSLSPSGSTTVSDKIQLKDSGVSGVGTWHVRLLVDGEPILSPFFIIVTPEELKNSISKGQLNTPHFVGGDKPFNFVGAFVPDGNFNITSAKYLIAMAKMSGLSVLTLMVPHPGDESSLRKLDIFIDLASAYGIYVIVTFIQGYGMSLLAPIDPFYSPDGIGSLIQNQKLKTTYKDLLTRVVTRTNTVNGKQYRDDPAIMGWDLITEPIYKYQKPNVTVEDLRSWVQEMTRYIRDFDPNHLITMCLTGPLFPTTNWSDTIAHELDFFFGDICLYDMLYKYNQPMTKDYVKNFYSYPLLALGKPVVHQLAFTSNILDAKFASDYKLQGQIYQEALQYGFQNGIAGMTIYSWGTAYNEGISQFEHYLTYDAMDEDIVIPLLKTSASLGTLDWPKSPLQFVRVAH